MNDAAESTPGVRSAATLLPALREQPADGKVRSKFVKNRRSEPPISARSLSQRVRTRGSSHAVTAAIQSIEGISP